MMALLRGLTKGIALAITLFIVLSLATVAFIGYPTLQYLLLFALVLAIPVLLGYLIYIHFFNRNKRGAPNEEK